MNKPISDEEVAELELAMLLAYPEAHSNVAFNTRRTCSFHLYGVFSVYIDKHVCCIYNRSTSPQKSYPSIPVSEVMTKLLEIFH